MDQEQFDFLPEIDAQAEREVMIRHNRIQEKLEAGWVRSHLREAWQNRMPAGTVVLVEKQKYDPATWRPVLDKTKYYRTVIGYHRAVSGILPELISEPDEEWPDVPPWQPGLSGKKWIYPTESYDLTFWVRKEDAT